MILLPFDAKMLLLCAAIALPNCWTCRAQAQNDLAYSRVITKSPFETENNSHEQNEEDFAKVIKGGDLKGWGFLYKLLVSANVPPKRAAALLSDPRMPTREPVYFRVKPKEHSVMYRKHNSTRNRRGAKQFYLSHRQWFRLAEKRYGVPAPVLAALLQVETASGRHTGKERVFYRLARLATVAEPENIENNIREQERLGNDADPDRITERALKLESMFLPQLIATIQLADSLGVSPHELRGSSGGAIGIPQFLPGNVSKYGVDADENGVVDVFHPADAIVSTARFLAESNWPKSNDKNARAKQRQALLHYNRSDAYVNTILAMASQLRL